MKSGRERERRKRSTHEEDALREPDLKSADFGLAVFALVPSSSRLCAVAARSLSCSFTLVAGPAVLALGALVGHQRAVLVLDDLFCLISVEFIGLVAHPVRRVELVREGRARLLGRLPRLVNGGRQGGAKHGKFGASA